MASASVGSSPQLSLNLTLGSFLSFPSRFIARLRRIDDMLHQDRQSQQLVAASAAAMQTQTGRGQRLTTRHPEGIPYEMVAMPGPLAFITSGYAVGLLAMAVLLNRIQHIVVPPRRSFAYRLIRSRRSLFHALFYSVFPVNLSSTTYRLVFRIPSLYLLFKSLFLLTIILLQSCGWFPMAGAEWIQIIGRWAGQKDMGDVCWSTFGAVCLALIVGALTRGLEGVGSSNRSPFNLFGYALLLHIYSVPLTHTNKAATPTRPDVNVLVTIIVPLLQLSMCHFLDVKRRWSKFRLVPTGICAMISLIHFNAVLMTKPSSYPLLNYLPSLLETLLLLVTLLTIGLNALTQLLLEGQITRPLFGHQRSLIPKWDEDFGIVLLRLGTASLEATSVAGLGNEVGSIATGISPESKTPTVPDDSTVMLTRSGVVSVTSKRHRTSGFANEIKNVKVDATEGDWFFDHVRLRELARFAMSVFAVMRGTCKLLLWMVWFKWRRPAVAQDSVDMIDSRSATPSRLSSVRDSLLDDEDYVYQRFLQGEVDSDDDEEYVPPAHTQSSPNSPHDSLQPSDNSDTEGDEEGHETIALYSDLLDDRTSAPAPVLLAHMTAPTSSPLTRRRYTQLLSDTAQQSLGFDARPDEWNAFVQARRGVEAPASTSKDAVDAVDSNRSCVICTTEPRDIICWPCRCLALCDDCRANLASRFAASKHTCPCCRRNVDGYSKIYIP